MDTITEITSVVPVPEYVLFCDTLDLRLNNKFKKIKVTLSQQGYVKTAITVYKLEIQGVKHKYQLKLSFLAKDICFLLLDEQQEQVPTDDICLPCFARNHYKARVYARLTIILYLEIDNVMKGAQCVKIPLLQRGNKSSTTLLHKLQDIVYKLVGGKEMLRHWPVSLLQCGTMLPMETVYITISRHALAIICNFQIMNYLPFLAYRLSITVNQNTGLLLLTEAPLSSGLNNEPDPGAESEERRVYKFFSKQGVQMKSVVEIMQRKNKEEREESPLAHFNIVHSEFSASFSGHYPGTTSDNVAITPHFPQYNGSGSSSGNGHIPGTTSDNVNVFVHNEPTPHNRVGQSSSGWHDVPGQISDDSCITTHNRPPPPPHTSLTSTDSSSSNGHIPGRQIEIRAAPPIRPVTLKPQDMRRTRIEDLSSPGTSSSEGGGTSGSGASRDYLHTQLSPSHYDQRQLMESWPAIFSNNETDITFFLDNNDTTNPQTISEDPVNIIDDVDDNDEDFGDVPPPAPCGMGDAPIDDFIFQLNRHSTVPKTIEPVVAGPLYAQMPLMRSQSVHHMIGDLDDEYNYSNREQVLVQMRNIHEDSPYYRFYYNEGFVRWVKRPSMRKKLKRRSRLSDVMEDLDFNLLEKHEKWYHQCFKARDKDLRFLRLHQMNTPAEEVEKPADYSYAFLPGTTHPDDPYWNSELCLTLQAKLQNRVPDVKDIFDITRDQFVGISVLLSLVPSEQNWKHFGEAVGLVSEDLSIIEHFCYTYRELAAEVVFVHWALLEKHKKACIACTRDSLNSIINDLGREDVKNVLFDVKTNLQEGPLVVTHF